MTQTAASTPPHAPAATPSTPPPAATPPPCTSALRNGRGNDATSETDNTEDDGGAIYSHELGLRTDFDIPKQVSSFRLRTVDIEAV